MSLQQRIGRSTVGRMSTIVLCSFLLLGGLKQLTIAEDAEKVTNDQPVKLLRHVVLFQFKEGATAEQVQELVDQFGKLPKSIPGIVDYEYGVNNSPEGLNEGLTHCFIVTFESEKARDEYLPHVSHKKFVQELMPHLEKAVVVDYWANR